MKIVENSIINYTSHFSELETFFEDCNYVVVFDCLSFRYLDSDDFNIKHLQCLFGLDVEGSIENSNFSYAEDKINESISYIGDGYGGIKKIENPSALYEHQRNFWDIVNSCSLVSPNSKVYKHEAELNSYFGNYVMWGFCYIFLHEGVGLVLAGQAWD